jgi:hypothetical protein
MDDDDLLIEVLLRLPPRPSSLPRVSFVCKRWRRIVADAQFLRRFCDYHREPPIVGVFFKFNPELKESPFRSILDPPDLIPPERFSARLDGIDGGGSIDGGGIWSFRGCRHGRVVFTSRDRAGKGCSQVLVWDPVTGDRRFIGSPPQLDHDWSKYHVQADVLCVAADKGHVHGACHSSPFKVVLVCGNNQVARACVYSSETNSWGDLISWGDNLIWTTAHHQPISIVGSRSILVRNSLYWFLFGLEVAILELNLDSQSLAMIEVPPDAHDDHLGRYLSTLGGALSFIFVSNLYRVQLWQRTIDFDGVARWMPGQTIELEKLLPLEPGEHIEKVMGAGEDNMVFVSTCYGLFMFHLESLQFEKIFKSHPFPEHRQSSVFPYPFTSFCAAGNNIHSFTPQFLYSLLMVLFPECWLAI